jgi:hypothetical protein
MPPPFFVSLPQTSGQLQACYHFFSFVHLHEVALGMPIVVSFVILKRGITQQHYVIFCKF